jgi:hypothetical protein
MSRFELRGAVSGIWAHWAAWAVLAVAFVAAGMINVFLAVSAHEWWPVAVALLAFLAAAVGTWMALIASRTR